MSISVLNTDAGLNGTTLLNSESTQTITGSKTFDRDPSAPFSVSSGSAKVTNLDADKLDGIEGAAYARLDVVNQFVAGAVGAVSVGVGDSDVGLYSSGTNALDVATNGVKALGIDSTQFIDSPTQPRCVAYNNTTQSLSDATETSLAFNAEDLDVGTMHDNASNNTRVTVPTGGDGFYEVVGSCSFAANTTGYRYVSIRKNGTTELRRVSVNNAGGSSPTEIQVSWKGNLVATDYVELRALQTSTGALNTGSATRSLTNDIYVAKLW